MPGPASIPIETGLCTNCTGLITGLCPNDEPDAWLLPLLPLLLALLRDGKDDEEEAWGMDTDGRGSSIIAIICDSLAIVCTLQTVEKDEIWPSCR
jgi:hypothetical protein